MARKNIKVSNNGTIGYDKNIMDLLDILGPHFYNGIFDIRINNNNETYSNYSFVSSNPNVDAVNITVPSYLEENKAFKSVCNTDIDLLNKELINKTINSNLYNTNTYEVAKTNAKTL